MQLNLTVAARSDIGCVRQHNEDAFVIADLTGDTTPFSEPVSKVPIGERGVLMAVSDGMGGHAAGEVASALVVESLRREMMEMERPPHDAELIKRAVERANRETWDASRTPGRKGMGATVTAVFVDGAHAYIAEVGDSRAYLVRGGQIEQVTKDQSYVQLLIDRGVLTEDSAARSPLRNVVLQAMGQSPEVQVALGKLELRQRDCLVICSDGLTNKVTADEMRQTILNAPRLDAACSKLVDMARERGGEDNITVILGGISGELPAQIAGEPISRTLEVVSEWTPGEGPNSKAT